MIYLDSNIIIRFVEGVPATREPIRQRLQGETVLVTSRLSRIECRCHPMGRNDAIVLGLFDTFFSSPELTLTTIDDPVIEEATSIRSRYRFRTPDAIHLASAVVAGATAFLTGDLQLTQFTGIAVEII
ncbi:MAG: type II toxin-antitoxin system VapC family toxin [Phycisphaerae bacterium]|nr:type II toxin-antitoxin system VapC family toxin [Tepidisphaeraceae bacterium]